MGILFFEWRLSLKENSKRLTQNAKLATQNAKFEKILRGPFFCFYFRPANLFIVIYLKNVRIIKMKATTSRKFIIHHLSFIIIYDYRYY